MYFYDGQSNSFYLKGFGDIPKSAIEISEKNYLSLIEGQAQGKQIIADSTGNPILIEPQPSYAHKLKNGEWVIDPEKQAALKAQQQEQIRQAINTLRDNKINGGVYVPAIDKWIDTDATAERNILSVKASFDLFGDQLGDIAWTCADNSILMINKDKLMLIWQALMQAKTGNHANALRHKAAVEQSENPLDYDYSGGWTKCYQDYIKEQGNE